MRGRGWKPPKHVCCCALSWRGIGFLRSMMPSAGLQASIILGGACCPGSFRQLVVRTGVLAGPRLSGGWGGAAGATTKQVVSAGVRMSRLGATLLCARSATPSAFPAHSSQPPPPPQTLASCPVLVPAFPFSCPPFGAVALRRCLRPDLGHCRGTPEFEQNARARGTQLGSVGPSQVVGRGVAAVQGLASEFFDLPREERCALGRERGGGGGGGR